MRRLSLILLSALLLNSCATTKKIEAMRPEPDDATPLVYDPVPSFIDLPIQLKLREIENQTNKYMTGLVYEDKNIADDDIRMSVWKTAPIRITQENGKIKTVFPMKIHAEYRIGTSQFGLNTTREFDLNGTVTLWSQVALNNWQMKSKSEIRSIDWNGSPTTTVFGKQIPITHLINPAIGYFKADIAKSLDESIGKAMDFRGNVLDALEKMSAPIQMNQAYDTWLRVNPIELYTTAAEIKQDQVRLDMGLKCNIETFIGQKPAASFDRSRIVLKPVAKMPDRITANILAISTYEDASRVISGNFAGQVFGSGKNTVTVKSVKLWHKSGKMIIALDLDGSLTGMVYLSGVPKYDAATKEIYIDQVDYAVDTKSRLVKTANWLASGLILKKVESLCRYSIQPNITEARTTLGNYLNNYSPVKGVFVNGSIQSMDFWKVQLTNRAILAVMSTQGKIDVTIDGLE